MKGLSLKIDDADRDALAGRGKTSFWVIRVFGLIDPAVRRLGYHLLFWLLSSPRGVWLTRRITDVLRNIHPIPKGFGFAVPLSAPALRNTLSRTDDFNGAETMSLRLPAGEVVLGIDWQRRHTEERARLERALDGSPDDDATRIRKIVRRRCRQVMPCSQKDLSTVNFARLFEDIALDVSEGHLGVGTYDDQAREDLRPIIRALASRVFQGPIPRSREDLTANIAADRMRALVECCKTRAKDELSGVSAKDPDERTILQRLLAEVGTNPKPGWLTEDWVVRNMVTLSVFGSVTSARAMTQALPHMLNCDTRRKMGLAAAAQYLAFENGEEVGTKSDWCVPADIGEARENLRKIVFEALRWHPMLSMLGIRTALRDTVLTPKMLDERADDADGHRSLDCQRQPDPKPQDMTSVKAGTKVLPMLLGAMHDPDTFEKPDTFCPFSRKAETYLHFGAGPHECVGRRMAEVQMEEIAYALFRHPFIRDHRIQCGPIGYAGPAVTNLTVRERSC